MLRLLEDEEHDWRELKSEEKEITEEILFVVGTWAN
jgi:hypothetical protein